MHDPPVRQCQVGDEVQPTNHFTHREVHHLRVDMPWRKGLDEVPKQVSPDWLAVKGQNGY